MRPIRAAETKVRQIECLDSGCVMSEILRTQPERFLSVSERSAVTEFMNVFPTQ